MESKEYITYSRRVKAGERPQQSLSKNNQFHGYQSTKQWIEEASQQCRGDAIHKAEQQEQQHNGRATMGLNCTPSRAASRKKDRRGVHFKQENEQSASRLDSKIENQASSLSPGILRKDCFPDGQSAALSPISLNVAAGGRQVVNSVPSAKHSLVVAASPQGVSQRQGEVAVICPDGRVQTMPSGKAEEGRQVVWCNAAFEADDDLRSHKSQDSASARSNRFSPASCSNIVESEVSARKRVQSLNERQDQQAVISNVNANPTAIFSPKSAFSFSPAISSASAVAGSSPATVKTKSPELNSTLPHVAQLEFEAVAGEWYTPVGSESTSVSSKSGARANERVMDLSKTRRTLAAMPSFKAAAPPTSWNSNRPSPGARVTSSSAQNEPPSSSLNDHEKFFTEEPSNFESAGRRKSKTIVLPTAFTPPRTCISDSNGPKSAQKRGSTPLLAGKVNLHGLESTPKQQRFQHDNRVETDLEADIEHEIEEEISKEILHLSQKLAALHARQETRLVGGGHEKSKTGGMSCPQTPLRTAPSPCGSEPTSKRKGRVVAAKFLQYKNDGCNWKHGLEKFADRNEKFNDAPFLGRPNPPRRSLGTPSRLLTKGKGNGQQRSSSPSHMVAKEELTRGRHPVSEVQSRGSPATKVTIEETVMGRAVLETGSRRVPGVLHRRNLGEERKEWIQWNGRGIGQSKKKEHQPASSLSTGSAAVQSHFYPEFERKVDWVKSLRNGPIPPAHPSGMMNFPGQALDERFLKQKSERQDIHAWLRENMGEAEGNGEISSFPPVCGSGTDEGAVLEEVHEEVKKMAIKDEEDSNSGLTPTHLTKPSNAWTTPLRNARAATPNRLTPNGKCTPSSGNARTVPSRYGTPVKATPAKKVESRSMDPKLIGDVQGARKWHRQTSPRNRGFSMRKVSPTIRKGYPGASGVRNGCIALGSSRKSKGSSGGVDASKKEQGVPYNNDEVPKVETKIIVVDAEYEKFVQDGVKIEKRFQVSNTVVGEHTGEGASHRVISKAPSITGHRDACEPPSSATKPPKKIFIRCSDLIKDKHSMLVKGKQGRLTGQSVLPSECQDSDDSVFPRSNTRTDSSEVDENNSRSEVASIVEESCSSAVKDSQLFSQRGDVAGVQFVTGSIKRPEKSRTHDYDVVYDFEARNPGTASYLPDDYTLEMMLQYVDTLKREREGLPRIRAVKDVDGSSTPRDSGCIKRTKEVERRARYYFKAGGGGNTVQVPKSACMDNEGLSPNEIEGLDLESFWCLVGEIEGPIMKNRP